MNDKAKQFEQLIENMKLPSERKVYNQANALWFIRYGVLDNMDHRYFDKAFHLARQLA